MEMKIKHGYESMTMKKFEWIKQFRLSDQFDDEPLVMFGIYQWRDVELLRSYKGPVVVVWMGEDSLITPLSKLKAHNITHVTWVPPIQRRLIEKGLDCKLLKISVRENPPVQELGIHVYSYLLKSKPRYHGEQLVKSLDLKHPLLIGDYSISREDWYAGENDKMYAKVFVGLALSNYAGGLMSVVEMGVRGIPVITNIIDLPHCIPWETTEDIEQAIKVVAKNIGKKNNELAEAVRRELVPVNGCFDLEKLMIK